MKPIETQYAGHRFRSRLEARWAVFFNAAGVEWLYEPEGFTLENGTRYLPDFYLPKAGCYVEVKGDMSRLDTDLLNRFARDNQEVLLLGPIPKVQEGRGWVHPMFVGNLVIPAAFNEVGSVDTPAPTNWWLPNVANAHDPEYAAQVVIQDRWLSGVEGKASHKHTCAWYIAAAGARFEHGERG